MNKNFAVFIRNSWKQKSATFHIKKFFSVESHLSKKCLLLRNVIILNSVERVFWDKNIMKIINILFVPIRNVLNLWHSWPPLVDLIKQTTHPRKQWSFWMRYSTLYFQGLETEPYTRWSHCLTGLVYCHTSFSKQTSVRKIHFCLFSFH